MTMLHGTFYTFFLFYFDLPYALKNLVRHKIKKCGLTPVSKGSIDSCAKKPKTMVLRRRGNIKDDEKWVYNNNESEVVSDFNYLGMVFNYTVLFVLNQETLAGNGLKALNLYCTLSVVWCFRYCYTQLWFWGVGFS